MCQEEAEQSPFEEEMEAQGFVSLKEYHPQKEAGPTMFQVGTSRFAVVPLPRDDQGAKAAILGPNGFVRIIRGQVLLGRSSQADIVLDDPKASRQHVYVEAENDGISFRDQGSENKTWVKPVPTVTELEQTVLPKGRTTAVILNERSLQISLAQGAAILILEAGSQGDLLDCVSKTHLPVSQRPHYQHEITADEENVARITVGRGSGNVIKLDDPRRHISSSHLMLTGVNRVYYLHVLGRNGITIEPAPRYSA